MSLLSKASLSISAIAFCAGLQAQVSSITADQLELNAGVVVSSLPTNGNPVSLIGKDSSGRFVETARVSLSGPELTNAVNAAAGVPTRTGSVLLFDRDSVYNSSTSPNSSSSVTFDFVGASTNAIARFYHQAGSEPSYPAQVVKVSGVYQTSGLNLLEFQFRNTNNVALIIYSGGTPTIPTNYTARYYTSQAVSTTSTNGLLVSGLTNISLQANSAYSVRGWFHVNASSTNGVQLALWSNGTNEVFLNLFGRDASFTNYTSATIATISTNNYNVFNQTARFSRSTSPVGWVQLHGKMYGGSTNSSVGFVVASGLNGDTATVEKGSWVELELMP